MEGTRESHPRVHDLLHPRLGKPRRGLQIIDTRMGFPCPFHSVVIDSIILVPETRKFHRKRGSYFFCLVPRVPVWYRACLSGTGSGTPFCSFTSVTMTSQRKAQRFPRRQRVPVTLKGTLLACFSSKCISQRGTRKIIKSHC